MGRVSKHVQCPFVMINVLHTNRIVISFSFLLEYVVVFVDILRHSLRDVPNRLTLLRGCVRYVELVLRDFVDVRSVRGW